MEIRRPDPSLAADLAYMAGVVERWAADLALAEEPARFIAALEAGAPDAGSPRTSA